MRTLKKGLSCLLVLNLLLGGAFVFAPKAEAFQSLLFPFITTETGKFTFITITNDGSAGPTPLGTAVAAQLHFSYATKAVPIVNKAGCDHFDSDVGTTAADMMIFEVNRKVTDPTGTTVLFESAGAVTSTPLALLSVNRVGFLIVETNAAFMTAGVGGGPFLFGTAAVVDSGSGLTLSYSTDFSSSTVGGAVTNADFTATDGGNYVGGVAVGTGGAGFSGMKNATWYPTSLVSTSWFVLPLSTRSVMTPVGGGGIRLGLRTFSEHLPTANLQGAFDLDESFFSGGRSPVVRCFGQIARSDFLGTDVDAATAGGGFIFLGANGTATTLAATDTVDPGGVYNPTPFSLFKAQSTSALGSPKSSVHREPDHDPCYNPAGVFPVGTICAGF